MIQIAEELDLDVDAFESCMDEGTFRDRVEETTAAAQEAGISGTPGFQINGEAVEWDGYEALAAAIDAELE